MTTDLKAISYNKDKIKIPNHEWSKYNEIWDEMLLYYNGGIDLRMDIVLTKYFREDEREFEYRCKTTPYMNFPNQIIEFIPKMVFQQDVSYDIPDQVAGILNDVDRKSTSLVKYAKESIILSRITTKIYILVDIDDDGIPYCVRYMPSNVINYKKINNQDDFEWIMFKEINDYQENITDDIQTRTTYRYWSKTEIAVWESIGTSEFTCIYNVANIMGEVPVIEIASDNLYYDLVKINKSLMTTYSNMGLNILLQNGLLILPEYLLEARGHYTDNNMTDDEVERKLIVQLKTNSALPETTESNGITRIIAPANTIPQHIQAMEAILQYMYKVGGIANLDDRNESGITKSYRFKETKATLEHCADKSETLMRNIVYYLMRMSNIKHVTKIEDIIIRIERNFDIGTMMEDILQLQAIGKTILASSSTFLGEFVKEKLSSLIRNIDNDNTLKIQDEIKAIVYDTAIINQLRSAPVI